MAITLELPPEVEGALAEEARQTGTTPEQFVWDHMRRKYVGGPEDAATCQHEGKHPEKTAWAPTSASEH